MFICSILLVHLYGADAERDKDFNPWRVSGFTPEQTPYSTLNQHNTLQTRTSPLDLEGGTNYYLFLTIFKQTSNSNVITINSNGDSYVLIARCFFDKLTLPLGSNNAIIQSGEKTRIVITRTCVVKASKSSGDGIFAYCNKCPIFYISDSTISNCNSQRNEKSARNIFIWSADMNTDRFYLINANFSKNYAIAIPVFHSIKTRGYVKQSTFENNIAGFDSGNQGKNAIIYQQYSRIVYYSTNVFIGNIIASNDGKQMTQKPVILNENGPLSEVGAYYAAGLGNAIFVGINSIGRSTAPTTLSHFMSFACYAVMPIDYKTPLPTPKPSPKPTPKQTLKPSPRPTKSPKPNQNEQQKTVPEKTPMVMYLAKRYSRMAGIA